MKKNSFYTQNDIMLLRLLKEGASSGRSSGLGQKSFNRLCRLCSTFTGCELRDVKSNLLSMPPSDIEDLFNLWFDTMMDDIQDGHFFSHESSRV